MSSRRDFKRSLKFSKIWIHDLKQYFFWTFIQSCFYFKKCWIISISFLVSNGGTTNKNYQFLSGRGKDFWCIGGKNEKYDIKMQGFSFIYFPQFGEKTLKKNYFLIGEEWFFRKIYTPGKTKISLLFVLKQR